ncbi:MAG: GNAT family N-acetyltransferase [Parasphingorhabdus sp.]|uniref:GNAT family N-acetyltransferase n=1 Tax=Parasphingorhabdus sp. TaxID=2709688 RepID=UPI003297DC0B
MQPGQWSFTPIKTSDLAAVHTLNKQYQHLLSPLTLEELRIILSQCFYHRCVEGGKAFITAMDNQSEHDGENFRWFKRRYDSFVYVDRIAIDKSHQRQGLAVSFYEDLEKETRKSGRAYLCAEVDLLPPNQASIDFHIAMGFASVGTGRSKNKTVQYFAKAV